MTGSRSCLGESDRESLTTGVTQDYDTGTVDTALLLSTIKLQLLGGGGGGGGGELGQIT